MDKTVCAVCNRAKLPQLQASLSGHVDCLMKTLDKAGLLDKKGRWEALETDDFGATALHLAARRNQIDCLRCLVKHAHVVEAVRAQNGASALHDAAATGSLDCLRYLVGNSNNSVLDRDNNGSTPLHWAVQAGKIDAVVWLVEGAEAPLDARTNTGVTPVHFAAAKNQLKVLQFLTGYERIKTGQLKTVNMQANNGATPTYFAAQEGNVECLRFLVEKCSSDPQTAASDGMRCVHAAAQEGHLACLKWLICNAGQSAKQRSSDGATPGHFAATQGHIAILRWLLECTDATGEELDNYGATLAHDAAEQGQISSLKYLHEQGISLNRQDEEGSRPVSLAEAGGHRQCVEFLKRAMLEKREPKARLSILDQVERTGYGLGAGVDTTDDELGASQDTIDGLTTSDEALQDGESERDREARLDEMQEHARKRKIEREQAKGHQQSEESEAREKQAEEKRKVYEAMLEAEQKALQSTDTKRALELLRRQQEQVALEKSMEQGATAEQKPSVDIEEGYALNIVKQANMLQAEINAAQEKERERIGKWKKSLPRADSHEAALVTMLENGLDDIPDELLQAELQGEDEEEEEERDLTPAEKKALRKAEKERKKAENKEKNKTLKKFGKIIRRQSEREERQRSASEPVPLEGGTAADATSTAPGSMPGSETVSLADESVVSLQRRRGLSDGSMDINEVQTRAQAKGFVRKRKSMFETKQVDRDRKVKSFSRWMKKSGRSKNHLPTTLEGEIPEGEIPEAPPAPAIEDLLPSGAVSPTETDHLSPRRRSLASRFGFSLSNLATSMSSLLNIGSTSTSPKPSRSVSFTDLKSENSSNELSHDTRYGDERGTSGIASMASTHTGSYSHHSSEPDEDDLDASLRSSGIMPSSLQVRLAEALRALEPQEQDEIQRLYQRRTPRNSVDEAMFIAEVEEKAASRKSSRDESAMMTSPAEAAAAAAAVKLSSSPMNESQKATLDEAMRMVMDTETKTKSVPPPLRQRRPSLEEALTASTAAERREREEGMGRQGSGDSEPKSPGRAKPSSARPTSLEDALQLSTERDMVLPTAASGSGSTARSSGPTSIDQEIVSVPGAPHINEPMSPVRGSWSEEKFPGNSPEKLLAALESALAQHASSPPSAALQWLQSPRNRLSPPDDIHDSLMQMMLAPKNMSATQLIAKLGTEQSIAGGVIPQPPTLPPPGIGGGDGDGGGIPMPPPPPPPDFIPTAAQLLATGEEKEQVFLDPIDEATEVEEEEDEQLMEKLYESGRPTVRRTRQSLLELIDRELEEKAEQQRKDAEEKEQVQQQMKDEQRRKSEKHHEQQLALQGRKSRVLAKSPIDGVVRTGTGAVAAALHPLKRTDTPRVLQITPESVTKLTKGPSRALIDALHRKNVLKRYMNAWMNHIRDRNLLILRLHAFMEKKARRLMLRCFLAWIDYRNATMAGRMLEDKAVRYHRQQVLRKALEGWCTVCGISDVSHARDYREKLNQQLQRNRDSLLSWINEQLPAENKVSNLTSDLASGLRVAQMLQSVSGKQAPRLVANPRLPVQKVDNWRGIQGFMKQLGMGEQRQQLQGLVEGDEYWTQNILHTTQRWLRTRT